MITTLVALCLAILTPGQTVTAEDPTKLSSLHQRAEAGDVKAQLELGFMYESGAGIAQRDSTEAFEWYHKAAAQGHVGPKHNVARIYFEGIGVTKNYPEAANWYGCPKPNVQALSSCREISYKDLPKGALHLLIKLKCNVSSNYGYGSAVDLSGDGEPEYLVCCKDASHGPCGSVVIGKIGSAWKELSAKEGLPGFDLACGLFVVLDARHNGFSDVCLPGQCSTVSSPAAKPCVPTIWHFLNGRYRSIEYTPLAPPK